MSDYAGFAVAVTIREHVLNDILLGLYHGGFMSHTLSASFGQYPFGNGSVNFFLQSPQIVLSGSDPTHAIVRLTGWGTMGWQPPLPGHAESATVQWQADLFFTPQFSTTGSVISIAADPSSYQLVAWQFDVVSGTPFSTDTQNFFNSDGFKVQLQGWLTTTIGTVSIPIINLSTLGPFQGVNFSTVALRANAGALLLGLDVSSNDFSTTGDPDQLKDVAGSNDIELVLNPDAIKSLMPSINSQVQAEVTQYGATLNNLTITCEEGQFGVTGKASLSYGSSNFSLTAVPRMVSGTPVAVMPLYTGKIMRIPPRSWPALSFVPTDVSADVHQAEWITIVGVIGSVVVGGVPLLGLAAIFDLSYLSMIQDSITSGIQGSELNPDGATPLLQEIQLPPAKLRIVQFEIHSVGVYVGLTITLDAPPATLSGIKSIPADYATQAVHYEVTLPFDAFADDPYLRIRWTVVDDSGNILLSDDDLAAGRTSFEFVPATVGPQVTRFAVGCRIYRALGPFITDLFNQTIRLTIGPALAPGAFVSWTYTVKNPQVKFDNTLDQWIFVSNRQLGRYSKIHRADKPCQNANKRSRFTPTVSLFDTLPFPISDILVKRKLLCDYCFFGGPGSKIAAL